MKDSNSRTIRILTFHTPINYGAILQAFALQKFVKVQFPEADVKNIDFKTEEHIRKYRIFIKLRKNIFYYLSYQIGAILRYKKLARRKLRFFEFLNSEFSLTRRYSSVDDLLDNVPAGTHYIVGSDQVFHPKSEYLRVFYLNFDKENSKKIAYAPSFGMSEFNEEVEVKIRDFLSDFDFLSCREKDGAEFLSRLFREKVNMVTDPVFLLRKTEWIDMAIKPSYSDKFIFVYDLNGGENLIKIARQIKAITGFSIVCQTQAANKIYNVDSQLFDLGPREFVGHMLSADYVVTDSFHGTAFSILFKKRQYIYVARPKASARIFSLMDLINGRDRVFKSVEDLNLSDFEITFDYDTEKIESLISFSKQYLINSIGK